MEQLRTQFLANISHELRTPMNGILGMAELALDADLTLEEMRHFMAVVKSSADALLTIINDILDFSKGDASKHTLESVCYSLRDTLFDALKSLAVKADTKQLELSCDVQDDVPDNLVGDAGRLRQIIVNLVGNALKFTHHGEVSLRVVLDEGVVGNAAEHGRMLHFAVTDSGIGIPVDKQKIIFEPFRQGDGTATRKYGGTGLGLTICRQLIDLMGGQLWLESSTSAGSTFHFTLPLRLENSLSFEQEYKVLQNRSDRVLVVDDNTTSLQIVGRMLNSLNRAATLVSNVSKALVSLKQAVQQGRPFGLILVDEKMPDLDGFEFCRVLRQAHDSTVVVMMLSSAASRQDALCSRELNIAAHLTKPFSKRELISAMNTAQKANGTAAAVVAPQIKMAPLPPLNDQRRLNILVAEDNEVNQELMQHVLTRNGHSVTVARDGKQALDAFKSGSFDLILMDAQMPRLDGIEATAAIRREEAKTDRHTPIIAITAYALWGDREKFLAAGMDEYLAKPLKSRELLQVIAAVTSCSKENRSALSRTDACDSLFNQAELLDHVDQDLSILRRMISILAEGMPQKLEAIQSAIDTNDAPSLERLVYRFRGYLSNFYSEQATQAVFLLESALRQADFSAAGTSFLNLKAILDRLTPELVAFVNDTALESNLAASNLAAATLKPSN